MTQKKTQKMKPPKNLQLQKKAVTKKKQSTSAAPVVAAEPAHWSEEDEEEEWQEKEEEEEEEEEDKESFNYGTSELKQLVRLLSARVDAVEGQVELVSEGLEATLDAEVQAKRKAVRKVLVRTKKVLLRTSGALLDAKAETAASLQASLHASRVSVNESNTAEVAKVTEELAMLPEAAGIRAVCDLYAGMRDAEEDRAAQANRPGSSVVC